MSEIKNPTQTKYWFVTDGTVLHTGKTEPNQVTTTNHPVLSQFDSVSDTMEGLVSRESLLPVLPGNGIVLLGRYFKDSDSIIYVITQHFRKNHDDSYFVRKQIP